MKNFKFVGIGFTFLFWFFSISASAFTLANGDTVTIKAGSYYLGSSSTTNGTAVTNAITTPAESTLWVVSASGTNWTLQNLQTGKYLLRSGNALQVSNTSTAWTIAGELLRTGTRGITCSGTGAWSMVNNGGSNLTIEKYHKAKQIIVERSLALSPPSMTFPMLASSQEFTPTAQTTTTERFYYTCGTPATIYSVADNMALSINAVSDIDMIPLAFRVADKSKAQHVTLQFNGINSFKETLYLYDAYTGNSTQIKEGESFDLEAPLADELRYYLRVMYVPTDVTIPNAATDDVTVYNKQAGSVLVYTSATIEKLTVFNMAGQMVEQEQNLWTNIKEVNLPTGVYLFEVVTDRGVANKKVLVR